MTGCDAASTQLQHRFESEGPLPLDHEGAPDAVYFAALTAAIVEPTAQSAPVVADGHETADAARSLALHTLEA